MKKAIPFLFALLLSQILAAQIDAVVTKPVVAGDSYIISNGQTETLEASVEINLLDGVHIQPGADFSAKIVDVPLFQHPYSGITLSDENYILTRSYQESMTGFNPVFEGDVLEQLTYFDGLGRPMQQLALKTSNDVKDIVSHIAYDGFGRMNKEWLPHESNMAHGTFRNDAKGDTDSYYEANYSSDLGTVPNPFSEKIFEPSPLNRVLQQGAPGYDWRVNGGHDIKFEYDTNTATDAVKRFDVSTILTDGAYVPTLATDGTYSAGELYKNGIKDENWVSGTDHTTEEFTDKQGRVVLKRTYSVSAHDTYYVYDDFGNLTYVLPPKMEGSTANMNELGYQYRYDRRNRLVEKRIPGKGWEYIVYNKLDQPIMTKDSQNDWLFTKYDAFGRVTLTGSASGGNRAAEQAAADAHSGDQWLKKGSSSPTGKNVGYTDTAYPVSSTYIDLNTVNYYDGYDTARDGLAKPNGPIQGQDLAQSAQGFATVSAVRVLTTNDWITTLSAYDEKGRAIYVHSDNPYLGTEDIVETKLDFAGKVVKTQATHKRTGQADIVTVDEFEYDHAARLKRQQQTLAGNTELIALNAYDGTGQLVEKAVGNTTSIPLQTVDYAYNIRGWLKKINEVSDTTPDKLFNFSINYNDPENGATPQYIQNVAEVEWRTATDNTLRHYRYGYDALYRLENAVSNNGDYDVSLAYDKMGNITDLDRQGHLNSGATSFGTMDDLAYIYDNGNKLLKVADNGNDSYGFRDGTNTNDDFEYDGNLNMTVDRNKGITDVDYNHLNMPTKVTVDGNGNNGVIDYVYAADGTKLQKKKTEGGVTVTTDYIGDFVYENGSLKQISQPEGYIEPDGTGWQYVYRYTDIWGNTRLTYADDNGNGSIDPSSEIRREQNYYPGGLEHKGYNNVLNGVKNNLKTYQAQEFTEELGLNTHEWRYRMSDPATLRFWQIDPLAEDYMYNSTFAFQENKFGIGIELEGLENISFEKVTNTSAKKVNKALNDLGSNFTTLEAKRQLENGMSNDPLVKVKNDASKKLISKESGQVIKKNIGRATKGGVMIITEEMKDISGNLKRGVNVLGLERKGKTNKSFNALDGADLVLSSVQVLLFLSEGDTDAAADVLSDVVVDQTISAATDQIPDKVADEETRNALSSTLSDIYQWFVKEENNE